MARQYKANIVTSPESVQEQSAEWKAQHAPVQIEPQQESIFVKLIEALGSERPFHAKITSFMENNYATSIDLSW